jgi:hypothetical protein
MLFHCKEFSSIFFLCVDGRFVLFNKQIKPKDKKVQNVKIRRKKDINHKDRKEKKIQTMRIGTKKKV